MAAARTAVEQVRRLTAEAEAAEAEAAARDAPRGLLQLVERRVSRARPPEPLDDDPPLAFAPFCPFLLLSATLCSSSLYVYVTLWGLYRRRFCVVLR